MEAPWKVWRLIATAYVACRRAMFKGLNPTIYRTVRFPAKLVPPNGEGQMRRRTCPSLFP
jgi:hypothetical protein